MRIQRLVFVSILGSAALNAGCDQLDSTGDTDGVDAGAQGADAGTQRIDAGGQGTPDAKNTPDARVSFCSTGTLFAGAPMSTRSDESPDPAGVPLKSDPPIHHGSLVFDGARLFVNTQQELWAIDTSAATPMEVRIAGQPDDYKLHDGACGTEARFSFIEGFALLPDHSLVVANAGANALVKVTNPTGGASCSVSYFAGNAAPTSFVDPPGGDEDGPGATAKLSSPKYPVSDTQGNVYFYDRDNEKIKKVGTDAAHTVTTIASIGTLDPSDSPHWWGMTLLGDKLYLPGSSGTGDGVVLEVDPGTGAKRVVVRGGWRVFPDAKDSTSVLLNAITNDGTHLFVSGNGRIWRLSLDGKLQNAAGSGAGLYFPDGYDPSAPHPADQLALLRNSGYDILGSVEFMTFHDGAIYWDGYANNSYVERIACP